MYYVFQTYMYYKGTLVVSGFTLVKRCLEKVFKPTRNGFKYIYPQTIFRYTLLYDVYHTDFISILHVLYFIFDFSILQASQFYVLSCSFIECVIYSLSHFSSFQVRYTHAHPMRGGNLDSPPMIGGYFVVIQQIVLS